MSDPITPAELAAMKARCEAATCPLSTVQYTKLEVSRFIAAYEALMKHHEERGRLLERVLEACSDDRQCCGRCEGNGRLWADGKCHHISENMPTMPCPDCSGSGYLPPETIPIDEIRAHLGEREGK